MRHGWVVEYLNSKGEWAVTAGAGLTKRDATREMNFYWRYNSPEMKFRVSKYVSAK